jgi:hypothetical protein
VRSMEEQSHRIVDRFMPQGRLLRLPSKAAKRQVVLEHLAQLFEPGTRYTEHHVDLILTAVCEGGETDHVSVRRYLVEAQLLGREAGQYWRAGGWVTGT